ncbi:MAG: type VI secretion system baseplate subunit TssK [Phycisphaeraceae bacterium]|nr:type VI secretion system baseplate subunit TssK [Phycisphaeraceae bacterium]MCW5753859.1 type VI secretion system baseplate subunit TssK [Phycisphaeraceae bacterium]
MTAQVHWHEGLFLQPHHLQVMQRSLLERLTAERRLGRPYAYGVVETRLNRDELENMRVRFDRLRAVMPSGLLVDVPESADLPALEIEQTFNSSARGFTVSLGVPLFYVSRANTIEAGSNADWRAKRMYRVAEIEQADENTGENPQPMQIRKVNARLMLDTDDRTDMEVLPLLRITRGTGQESGLPRADPGFIPSCLVIDGNPTLRDMLRDLSNQIEASRKELVVQMTRAGFSIDMLKGAGFQQMLKLQVLNRFSGRLPSLVAAGGAISPFDMYLELRDCLGGLAALHPDTDPFEAPRYDHDNPAVAFTELSTKIRSHLKVVDKGLWLKVAFRLEGGVLVAELEDKHLTGPNEYFLGVKTGEDPRSVARLVEHPDEFKLMNKSLIQARVRGVALKEERHPPLVLPAQVGLSYFRLLRAESARTWERINQERSVAIKFDGVDQGRFEEVALYMTIPG